MGQNRLEEILRPSIMEKEQALTEAPQGGRAELIRPCIPLRDPIRQRSAHAVEEEIRIQSYSCQFWRVAQRTSHLVMGKGGGSAGNRLVSPWFLGIRGRGLQAAHERREEINITGWS